MTFEQSAIEEFLRGKIIEHHLDGHGISSMSVRVAGKRVTVSWYSSGNTCSIAIDGNKFPSGSDSMVSAAKRRAKSLAKEFMDSLDDLVK